MKKMILGIGNTLNRDEGLGIHALEYLRRELQSRKDIEIEDGGTLGLNLLPVVEGCSHLLVLDTIDAGKTAGVLTELSGDSIPLLKKIKMSGHQTTFQEVLTFAKIRGKLPGKVYLLGIQPGDTTLGMELSSPVKASIPELINRAKEIVAEWPMVYY